MIKEISYKGKTYHVTDPGKLIYSKTKLVSRKYNLYQIVDQLDNLCEIKKSRIKYLERKYGITELDYYIIVVLEGDETKLPKCGYVNPKTKEVCDKPKKFYSLVPTIPGRGIFYIGCKDHTINASAQVKQRICYKKHITGLQKADRRSRVWREKLRQHALKQIAEGNSIFSPDEIRRPDIKKPISSIKISGYNKLFSEMNIDRDNCCIEDLIKIDKEMFLRKGNPDDTCYYYISYLENNDKVFKLGVTSNIDSRIDRGYNNCRYIKLRVLYTATRTTIAELEELVKLEFKDYIILGNEGFDISIEDKAIKFIDSLILKFKETNRFND